MGRVYVFHTGIRILFMRIIHTIIFFLLTGFSYGQDISFDTILVNNKVSFLIKTKPIDSASLLLISTSGTQTTVIDTIQSDGLAYIKYPDFNKDGYADILIDYYGNNPTYFLYLFDPATNRFKAIHNYMHYPNAVQLKTNPQYYYSYHRAGCADMNWVSDLFKIEDFKITHLGRISGNGCDADPKEEPQIILVYKVKKNDEQLVDLIEKLPYLKHIPRFGYKWTFIQKYWNKNYTKFE